MMSVLCYTLTSYRPTAVCVFFLMIRRPPRSTLDRSSAASDVYKRQLLINRAKAFEPVTFVLSPILMKLVSSEIFNASSPVSYTHLRAHETVLDLVCRLLLEKKNTTTLNELPSTYTTSRERYP